MQKIIVAGLGPWETGYVTEKARRAMDGTFTVFRTMRHPEAEAFQGREGCACLDGLYARARDFTELNRALAREVMKQADAHGTVVYAVPGQGAAGDSSVRELLQAAAGRYELDFIPGVEEASLLLAACAGRSDGDAYSVVPAAALDACRADRALPLVVTQLDSRLAAGKAKLRLVELWGDQADAVLWLDGRLLEIKLFELDRQEGYDHRAMLWLPPADMRHARYDLYGIVAIMDRLRGPGGCPWDREQTHETLIQYLLEETYEVIEAVNRGDMRELCEELGDVLLQVVFHARMAAERGDFDITDVSDAVSRKMILRHPHIFGDANADTPDDVVRTWEDIKKQEKGQDTETGMMRQIPQSLPAILRSMKVQGKAARVGFDWNDVWGAYEKLEEEVGELREAITGDMGDEKLADEFGDVLFAAVNVARFIKVHPEFALKGTVEKFIRRFEYVEKRSRDQGRELETMTLEEMDAFWNEAKALE